MDGQALRATGFIDSYVVFGVEVSFVIVEIDTYLCYYTSKSLWGTCLTYLHGNYLADKVASYAFALVTSIRNMASFIHWRCIGTYLRIYLR